MLEFSAFMGAVKPKERTDQYVVLAALYCLNAHTGTVTARQVADLLRLNLGAKAPSNVNLVLRRLSPSVEPKDKGPPLKRALTQNGLTQLRQVSGLALSAETSASDFDYDVAIICALEQGPLQAAEDLGH